jgi:hypothetical protein
MSSPQIELAFLFFILQAFLVLIIYDFFIVFWSPLKKNGPTMLSATSLCKRLLYEGTHFSIVSQRF